MAHLRAREGRRGHGVVRQERGRELQALDGVAAADGVGGGGGDRAADPEHLRATSLLSQGVQVRRKALRICHINGMEVRKKRPRGFKKRPRGFK